MGSTSLWKSPLAREISLMLALKAMALGAIWFAFFSHPAVPSMRIGMDPARVETALLAHQTPAQGAGHEGRGAK